MLCSQFHLQLELSCTPTNHSNELCAVAQQADWLRDRLGRVLINNSGPDVRLRRIIGHRKAAFNQSKMTRRKRQTFCITSPRRFLGLLGYI